MKLTHVIAMNLIVGATALHGVAQADSVWVPASTDTGFTYQPDHLKSNMTRAQVMAEAEIARKDGTLALLQVGLPVPIISSAPPNPRQQVIDEMRNESPQARRERLELYYGYMGG